MEERTLKRDRRDLIDLFNIILSSKGCRRNIEWQELIGELAGEKIAPDEVVIKFSEYSGQKQILNYKYENLMSDFHPTTWQRAGIHIRRINSILIVLSKLQPMRRKRLSGKNKFSQNMSRILREHGVEAFKPGRCGYKKRQTERWAIGDHTKDSFVYVIVGGSPEERENSGRAIEKILTEAKITVNLKRDGENFWFIAKAQ